MWRSIYCVVNLYTIEANYKAFFNIGISSIRILLYCENNLITKITKPKS